MWTLYPDVFGVEVVGLSPSDAVPLEALQELLGEREVAVVRVEYVDVVRDPVLSPPTSSAPCWRPPPGARPGSPWSSCPCCSAARG